MGRVRGWYYVVGGRRHSSRDDPQILMLHRKRPVLCSGSLEGRLPWVYGRPVQVVLFCSCPLQAFSRPRRRTMRAQKFVHRNRSPYSGIQQMTDIRSGPTVATRVLVRALTLDKPNAPMST